MPFFSTLRSTLLRLPRSLLYFVKKSLGRLTGVKRFAPYFSIEKFLPTLKKFPSLNFMGCQKFEGNFFEGKTSRSPKSIFGGKNLWFASNFFSSQKSTSFNPISYTQLNFSGTNGIGDNFNENNGGGGVGAYAHLDFCFTKGIYWEEVSLKNSFKFLLILGISKL